VLAELAEAEFRLWGISRVKSVRGGWGQLPRIPTISSYTMLLVATIYHSTLQIKHERSLEYRSFLLRNIHGMIAHRYFRGLDNLHNAFLLTTIILQTKKLTAKKYTI